MALDRTNMVSLLDIGSLFGGLTADFVMLGDGFTSLAEDWSPNIEDKQYINMKNSSSSVTKYALSMSLEREYLSDDVQTTIDKLFTKFPTGSACETFYGRFYKSDVTSGSAKGIKVPVTIAPSSVGGGAGETLTASIELHGNGDVIEGTWTIGSDGTYTFVAD